MKKIWLGFGAIATTVIPLSIAVSCGDEGEWSGIPPVPPVLPNTHSDVLPTELTSVLSKTTPKASVTGDSTFSVEYVIDPVQTEKVMTSLSYGLTQQDFDKFSAEILNPAEQELRNSTHWSTGVEKLITNMNSTDEKISLGTYNLNSTSPDDDSIVLSFDLITLSENTISTLIDPTDADMVSGTAYFDSTIVTNAFNDYANNRTIQSPTAATEFAREIYQQIKASVSRL